MLRELAVGMVINVEDGANVPESEKLTQDTSLDTDTLAGLMDPKPQPRRDETVHTTLIRTQYWTNESIELRDERALETI